MARSGSQSARPQTSDALRCSESSSVMITHLMPFQRVNDLGNFPLSTPFGKLRNVRRLSLAFYGSAQKSDEASDLGCFFDDNEFGPGGGHPLGLEQEITEVLVAAA